MPPERTPKSRVFVKISERKSSLRNRLKSEEKPVLLPPEPIFVSDEKPVFKVEKKPDPDPLKLIADDEKKPFIKSEEKKPKLPPPEPIVINGHTLYPTEVFDTFWYYCAERKAMDDRRRAGMPEPWTDDKILREYRFCNVFRILDKVSQYIVRDVIEKGSQDTMDVIFRIVLFNSFSKIETYEILQNEFGPLTWEAYNREAFQRVLDEVRDGGTAIYTGAFQKPAPKLGYKDAYKNHLELLELLMQDLPDQLATAEYLEDVFDFILSLPGMGNFSAYQLLLNLTYSNVINFAESDFVVPGLGAQSGLTKLFGKSMSRANQGSPGFEAEVMRWLQKTQDEQFKRLGLEFSGLGPDRLPMQLCDIEHTLCEVDKYARLSHPHIAGLHGRTHMKQSFKQSALFCPEFHIPKAWAHPDRKTVRIRPGPSRKVSKLYVIHSIVGRRQKQSGVQYKVHWWGYSNDDDTWEPEKELKKDAPEVIEAYLASIS